MFGVQCNQTTSVRLLVHGIGLSLLMLTSLGYTFVIHRPLVRQRVEENERSGQLAALLSRANRVRSDYSDSQQKLASLTREIHAVRERIPDAADDGAFLSALASIAEDEGLQLVDYRRGRAATVATHSHVELELKCIGNYSALCRFIQRVEAMPRISKLSQLTLQSFDGNDEYRFEIRLILYHGLHAPTSSGAATSQLEDAS